MVAAEPEIAALARNHPDNYYASAAADELFEFQGEAMIAQEPQPRILAADQAPPHADDYDDAADFEAVAEAAQDEGAIDFEDDPDTQVPEIWDDGENYEPADDEELGDDYESGDGYDDVDDPDR